MAPFKKLMQKQVQETLNTFIDLAKNPMPQKGWIRTIRQALGITSNVLAKKMQCSRTNITLIEKRELQKTVTLETLDEVAKAMNCRLVYCLIPEEPLEKILEKQAQKTAHEQIQAINHSMKLEQQGLTSEQLQQQEKDLVQELLRGNPKKLWD